MAVDFSHSTALAVTMDQVRRQGSFWVKHRFFLLISGAIFISLILVIVSMVIYSTSGSVQLDLSRPGYQSVSNQVVRRDSIESFSSSGTMNLEVVESFIELYDEQAAKAKAVDAFSGDPLHPEVLEFTVSEPAVTQ